MSFFPKKPIPQVSPKEGYRRWAPSYSEATNPIKENSDRLIQGWFPVVTGKNVLDVGCGPGKFCSLAEHQGAALITGTDLSPEMIALAKEHCVRTEFFCQDLTLVDLPKEKNDLVICALVLGHCQDLKQPLQNLGNSVRPEGVLLVTDFHPLLSLQKAKRTFIDPATRQTTEILHFVHLLNDYFLLLPSMGFIVEEVKEPKWKDQPVVFGIKARKLARP